MKYELAPLKFDYAALEPWIDAKTVEIHHDKHQATYVTNLNNTLEAEKNFVNEGDLKALLANLDIVPENIRTAVRNNGGGVWNHTFYWEGLTPEKTKPSEKFAVAVNDAFGNMEEMIKKLNAASVGRFGSGWGWLCADKSGKLFICSTPNQDSPIMGEKYSGVAGTPLFTIDVWEHAYYLKYQNLRAKYAEAIWNLANWEVISCRFDECS